MRSARTVIMVTMSARRTRGVVIALAAGLLAAPPASALPAGAVDPQFAGGEVLRLPAASASGGGISAAAPDGLGGLVGAGLAFDGDGLSVSVVQRDAGGAPVVAFGGDGEARVALTARALGIGRQPSGRTIVLAGDGSNPARVVAFTAAGDLDESFAPGGVLSLEDTPIEMPQALAVDHLGRILLAGDPPGVMRLTAGGEPDPTFGGGGLASIALPPDSSVHALAAGAAGDVVVSATLRTQGGVLPARQRGRAPDGARRAGSALRRRGRRHGRDAGERAHPAPRRAAGRGGAPRRRRTRARADGHGRARPRLLG